MAVSKNITVDSSVKNHPVKKKEKNPSDMQLWRQVTIRKSGGCCYPRSANKQYEHLLGRITIVFFPVTSQFSCFILSSFDMERICQD